MAASVLEYTPKTKILLGGSLGRKFGRKHSFLLDTGSVREMVKAIDVNYPGFARELADAHLKGLVFAVFRNGKNIGEGELDHGGCREIRLVPVIAGSKRGGALQTIVGAVLIVAGAVMGNPGLVKMGVVVAVGGVTQMLSPQLGGLNTSAAPENQPSYAFGSARNTTASGNPVPLCIGKRRWGGAIISAGVYAEDQM